MSYLTNDQLRRLKDVVYDDDIDFVLAGGKLQFCTETNAMDTLSDVISELRSILEEKNL